MLKMANTSKADENGFEILTNYFDQKPKAIRHFESLFPNNYLDPLELKNKQDLENKCNLFERLLSNPNITELNIKRFIQNNRYYFIPGALFQHFDFGHHEAYLFKEFPLGTSYKADYLLIGKSSGGYHFVLVEFENPYGDITLKNGEFGNAIRKGIAQINDWESFLQESFSSFSDELKKSCNGKTLPNEFYRFDMTRFFYLVVAGRRKDYNNKTYRLRRDTEMKQNISIFHYDNLLDDARNIIGKKTY